MSGDAAAKAAGLCCWSGAVEPEPISGGITNVNFVVADSGQRYFVRIGEDIPIHGVLRFNEVAAARAAEMAGVSPQPSHFRCRFRRRGEARPRDYGPRTRPG